MTLALSPFKQIAERCSCSFRCCTTINFNGNVTPEQREVAETALEGRKEDPNPSNPVPGFLTRCFTKCLPKRGSTAATAANSTGRDGLTDIQTRTVAIADRGAGASFAPSQGSKILTGVPLQRVTFSEEGEGGGARRAEAADASEVETSVITKLTVYLFNVLKNVDDDAVFINTYKFSQKMVNEIRELFEISSFFKDLEKKQRLKSEIDTVAHIGDNFSIGTIEHLTQFEATYKVVLEAAKKEHPNP